MTRPAILWVLGALIGVSAVWGLVQYTKNVEQALTSAPAADGPAPVLRFLKEPRAIPALALQDLDGGPLRSESWKGKVVLVNFWATWCPPCRAEIPDLVALQAKYRDTLVVLGVSEDEGSVDAVRQFAAEHRINYPIVMSTPELRKLFTGVYALPTTFLLDPEGRIAQKHVGLLNASITELETRALAGMDVRATIERVDGFGQSTLTNAAQATEIPGIDLTTLSAAKKTAVLKRLNDEHCTCSCELTLAECRINDPQCGFSLPLAQKAVDEIAAAP